MPYLRAYRDLDAGDDLVFVASTPGVKSDGLSIDQSRWDLSRYMGNEDHGGNNVFLWCHQYDQLPVGAGDAWVEGDRLRFKPTKWARTALATDVHNGYDDGILNAVSVGWEDVDEDGAPIKRGQTAARHVLLDISAVPVPGDPDALAERGRRALEALGHELLRVATTDTADEGVPVDVTPVPVTEDTDMDESGETRGEDAWADVAAAMVAVFNRESDDPDEDRQSAYRALLPKYRRHGVAPPELLTADEMHALGDAEWRSLFLAGELEATGYAEYQRVGAVLNARNMARIKDARDLLSEVLDSAGTKDTPAEDESRDVAERATEEPEPVETDNELDTLRAMRAAFTEADNG